MLDTSRASKEFGFKAMTPFDIGLKKTIDWHTSTKQTKMTRETRETKETRQIYPVELLQRSTRRDSTGVYPVKLTQVTTECISLGPNKPNQPKKPAYQLTSELAALIF
jgi:hypothetical protein